MSRNMVLIVSLFTVACGVNGEVVDEFDQSLVSPNGRSFDGVDPIGGPGGALVGIRPRGTSADGRPLEIATDGEPLAGRRVVGSTWTGQLASGATVALRIDAARDEIGLNRDLWAYRVSVRSAGAWRPLCGSSGYAVNMPGVWNKAFGTPDGGSYHAAAPLFTMACRGSSIAKCLEFGYAPWDGRGQELTACVRALRGDYCGDGTSYTVDGTLVNLYDRDLVADTVDWHPEAEWTANGASCISRVKETRFWSSGAERPWCYPASLRATATCGTRFGRGTMLITELKP